MLTKVKHISLFCQSWKLKTSQVCTEGSLLQPNGCYQCPDDAERLQGADDNVDNIWWNEDWRYEDMMIWGLTIWGYDDMRIDNMSIWWYEDWSWWRYEDMKMYDYEDWCIDKQSNLAWNRKCLRCRGVHSNEHFLIFTTKMTSKWIWICWQNRGWRYVQLKH